MTNDPRRRNRLSTVGIAAVAIVLLMLAGCSAAGRVLLGPPCRDATAAPRPAPPVAGTVYAFRPHLDAANGRSEPQAVPGWTDVVSIAGSGFTTFAVKADGTVWAYGLGHKGVLGDGDLSRHVVDVPRQIAGIADARSVHVVGDAAFVVRSDGTVLGWGEDLLAHGGQRTDPLATVHDDVATPIPVDGLADVVTIADGDLAAVALLGDGTVAGWGHGASDILGRPAGDPPFMVGEAGCVVSAAPAGSAVVVATADGAIRAWGNNGHGLLTEDRFGPTEDPVTVSGPAGAVQVAGGRHVAYALDATGGVWAWGRGAHGALGDGDISDHVSAVPNRIAGLPVVRWIGAKDLAAFAIDAEGGLWGWGWGPARGPDALDSARPVRIPLPGPALAVSGGHAIVRPSGT